MLLKPNTIPPMEIFYKNNVVASVKFDESGVLEPLDFSGVKGLRKAKQNTELCFVRDVEAHETVAVRLVDGEWKKVQEDVSA